MLFLPLLQHSILYPLKPLQLQARSFHLIQFQYIGIGSGGNYALAAAKVLMDTELNAEEVAKKAIKVAADICVFTNDNIRIEKI